MAGGASPLSRARVCCMLLAAALGEETRLDRRLLGPDGAVVPGPFNTAERVITVARDTASGAME